MLGSSVFAGRIAAADALASSDDDGVSLGEALTGIGYAGRDEIRPAEFSAYLEAHIEQGPILEDTGVTIGVVDGVQAQFWTRMRLVGEQAHAGTFPLEARRDALVAAADVITAVRAVGLARPGVGRATVGRLLVAPNSPNVVPGEVEFVVELRHPDAQELARMLEEVHGALDEVATQHGVDVEPEFRS